MGEGWDVGITNQDLKLTLPEARQTRWEGRRPVRTGQDSRGRSCLSDGHISSARPTLNLQLTFVPLAPGQRSKRRPTQGLSLYFCFHVLMTVMMMS